MALKSEHLTQNIKNLRKLQKRSIHDCASFLNLSRENYLKLEQDQYSPTLPEIELLAQFFYVSVKALFQSNFEEAVHFPLFDCDIHSDYMKIRNKMIGAAIASELSKSELDLQSLREMTQIPQEALDAYINALKPVPLNHLLQLHDALSLSDEIIFNFTLDKGNHEDAASPADWIHEYPGKLGSTTPEADSNYDTLIEALKLIPGKDQAEIARLILQKLKQA